MFFHSTVMSVWYLKKCNILKFLFPFSLSRPHYYIQFLPRLFLALISELISVKKKKRGRHPARVVDPARINRDRRANFVGRTRRGHDRSVFRQRKGAKEKERERSIQNGREQLFNNAPVPRNRERGCSQSSHSLAISSPAFLIPLLILSPMYMASSSLHSILCHPLASLRSVLSRERRAARSYFLRARAAMHSVPFSWLSSTFSLPPFCALLREHRPLVSLRGERNKASLLRDDIARREDLVFMCLICFLLREHHFFFIRNSFIEDFFEGPMVFSLRIEWQKWMRMKMWIANNFRVAMKDRVIRELSLTVIVTENFALDVILVRL